MLRIDLVAHRDAIVIGSGVAGLTTALSLGRATVITKGTLGWSGSTPWSQGGIAASLGRDDSPALHAGDTVAVSGGIGEQAVAALLTGRAASRIQWLQDLGAEFDRAADGSLALGREAGHSRFRIVHAGGDATGAEVARALTVATRAHRDIEVVEHAYAVDLIRRDDRVAGVLVIQASGVTAYLAPAVVIATGGIGRVYARTTNSPEVTGDGLAMAARAGATLADLEFVQFHPTALAATLDPMPLLTEALRGAGAILVDGLGRRFMRDVHPAAELAPRDIVARAVFAHVVGGQPVYLDARQAVGAAFPDRFPTVFEAAMKAGIDPRTQLLPVSPAAHYHMGGIAVDEVGQTSLPGLWAAGEAASSGVHGANRLASNSLLEGLVFGATVADAIVAARIAVTGDHFTVADHADGLSTDPEPDIEQQIRETMWANVGVVRDATGLERAIADVDALAPRAAGHLVARNMLDVARLVAESALARTESRGAHYRADYPDADAEQAHRSFIEPVAAPAVAFDAARVAGVGVR
ncbi:MAG: L-aspartate oxidase [Acidobacteria bacterium]|nr:L-aspartate oxidase [Acidobacteriota bacterium]